MAGYLATALNSDPNADPGALATPMPDLPNPRPRPGKRAQAARKQFNQELAEQMTRLSTWWLQRMTPSPTRSTRS